MAAALASLALGAGSAAAVKDENVLVSFQGTTLLAESFTDGGISANGRYAVFETGVGIGDVYRRDLVTGALELVSVDATGGPADDFSANPSVSADGRYVLFRSRATDLVSPAPPAVDFIYVRDMVAGTTVLASRASDSGGTPGAPAAVDDVAVLSADGRHVLFVSDEDTLYPGGDPDGGTDQPKQVYHRNLNTGTTELVSRDDGDDGPYAPNGSLDMAISGDGRYAAFETYAPGFADTPAGEGDDQIYLRDLVSHTNVLVSTGSDEQPIVEDWDADVSQKGAISDDGSRVAFTLNHPEEAEPSRAFVRDLSAGTTHELSVTPAGQPADSYAFDGALSGDGQVALFESGATNLGADDDEGEDDLFVRAVSGGPVTLVSRLSASLGNGPLQAGQGFWDYGISGTGRYVLFGALDARLIPPGLTMPEDDELESQLFVRDLTGDPPVVNPPGDTVEPTVSGFALTNKAFRVGAAPTPLIAKKKKKTPKGTTFKFTLDEAATVKLAISRESKGRKVKGKCRRPTRKNRKKKKCTRLKAAGTLTRAGVKDANSVPFSGRIGSKKLKPGKYRVTITATDEAGNVSPAQTKKFKVVKG